MKKWILPFIILCGFSLSAQAQFGNLIKKKLEEKANDVIKKKIVEKSEEKRSEIDSTSFNYAIAFTDNAGLFEQQEEGEGITKFANTFLKDEEDKSDLDKARSSLDFGEFLYKKGRYFLAEVYLQATKQEYEALDAKNDVNYFRCIATLGLLYDNMGRYSKAKEFTQEALDLRKENLGEGLAYAASLNNLAVLQLNLGEYNEAEKKLEKVAQIQSAHRDEFPMPYAITLNNQALLYQAMGRYEEAKAKLEKVLPIAKEALGENDDTYLQLLTNQAFLFQEMGNYDEAERTYKKAIDTQESRLKIGKKNDPIYAHMLNNLASLYMIIGKEDKVEDLLQRSLEIYQSKYGEQHPATASAERDLGNFYRYKEQYEKARPLLKSAYENRLKTLPTQHPAVVNSEEDLAILAWKTGDIDKAATLYDNVMSQTLHFINNYFPPMSESEKTKYWESLQPRFFRFYSFAEDNAQQKPELLDAWMDYRLATKGLLLNATHKIKNQILNSGDQELVALYKQWQDQKRQLALCYSLSEEELDKQNINLDSLQNAANQTERSLSAKSSDFADAFVPKSIDYHSVQGQLKAGEVLIEMVQYPYFKDKLSDETHYAALILAPGEAHPKVVTLDNGEQLDHRYYSYYKNVIQNKIEDKYSYKQYWAPIAAALPTGTNKIYFSPDGIYLQVNVNTFKNPYGKYVIEDYPIITVSNSQDIRSLSSRRNSSKKAFLAGAPDFGGNQVAALPGTQKELNIISQALRGRQYQVTLETGNKATEANIKSMHDPAIVHLATHGFFMEDTQNGGQLFGVNPQYARSNPLLRSGLLFAGAGKGLSQEKSASFDSDDNGILTAYEAASLPLDQTDMVVLSACETGVGDVKAGEGVYGLERAFLIAGAQSLVISLWKVNDATTQELMANFYKYWLQNQDARQAFRNAALALKKKYPDPYYWGAFVMVNR